MIDKIKEALATHEGEPGVVGYALVIFNEDGSFSLDAEVSQTEFNEEAEDGVITTAPRMIADLCGMAVKDAVIACASRGWGFEAA